MCFSSVWDGGGRSPIERRPPRPGAWRTPPRSRRATGSYRCPSPQGRESSYLSRALPKTLLHFGRPFCFERASPASPHRNGIGPGETRSRAPKTRRDHVDGLFRLRRRPAKSLVMQKLYSAVAFGSPLLTSAEYSNTLARHLEGFKGIETHISRKRTGRSWRGTGRA